ncbi:cysteine synthase [Thermosyntropha lipolytica DSM 11003]|uniref:Cysteine synthase n=1 Tax=Thermosyntropha lipolytica DSM 11003 TaxID=1123382 RepID=A0A1M5PC06_9FIRM|nr:cysteine synthase A [Thermosyntropha lipolytica]SHG98763.1 cysteine synthase [Thermosyntropha lipolytica DSM 11003]
MKVVDNMLELVGGTPVVKLNRLTEGMQAEIYVKLECFNPAGSLKDRAAFYMLEKAEAEGKLKKGMTVIEATTGNTGIGLAMAAAVKGYKLIIVMPANMSEERRKILEFYGAEVLLTPPIQGMLGAVEKAKSIATADPDKYYLVQQFSNPYNAESHALYTAREILDQMGNNLDAVVIGVGSGGTLTGVAEVLKKEIPDIDIIAVEPKNSAVLSGGSPGAHEIQGIGAGFIPPILKTELIDYVFAVKDGEAIDTCRQLARKEGIAVGISSGAAVFAALKVAEKKKYKKVLAIAPDGAEKYISTLLFG